MPKKPRDTSDAAIKKRMAEYRKLSPAEKDKQLQEYVKKRKIKGDAEFAAQMAYGEKYDKEKKEKEKKKKEKKEKEKKKKKKFEKGRKKLAKIVSPKKGKVSKEEFEKARKDLMRK